MPDWSPRLGTHPDLETLSAYVDGVLVEGVKADIEAHLAICEPCLDLVTNVMASSTRTQASEDGASSTVATPTGSNRDSGSAATSSTYGTRIAT